MRASSLSYERGQVVGGVGDAGRPLRAALLAYPVGLLVLSFVTMVAPQRTGWLAVAQVFGPHLFLPLMLLVPVAFVRGMVVLRVALLVCLGVFGMRFMPPINVGTPAAGVGAAQFSVLTWNVFAGNGQYDEVGRMLAGKPADVVVLQEADGVRIEGDARVAGSYPYGLEESGDVPPGMVFLSRYPIVAHGALDGAREVWDIPRLLWVKLDLGDGRVVTVVDAHPMSAYSVGKGCSLAVCYSPLWRDEQIGVMRANYISPMLDSGEALIVAGDFNITEREAGYEDLSRGLTDAWRAVGSGYGTTWRPGFMMGQGLGLLRIDYLFASPKVRPLSMSVDCTPRGSDHCAVVGRFGVE